MNALLPAAALLLLSTAQKFHEVCGVCHSEIASDFLAHPHSRNALDCDSCHGASLRHRSSEGGSPPDRLAIGREIPALCEACHAGDEPESIGKQFFGSKHGRTLLSGGRSRAPHCGTCHGVHRVRPPRGMERACKQCHDTLPAACGAAPPKVAQVSCAGCHQPHRFAAAP
jgi:hypothetical protein